jgi:hypothetical protein
MGMRFSWNWPAGLAILHAKIQRPTKQPAAPGEMLSALRAALLEGIQEPVLGIRIGVFWIFPGGTMLSEEPEPPGTV